MCSRPFYPSFEIAGRQVGGNAPCYFVADIAANHDGDLERALNLIYLAAEAGADAAKFQNFRASQIVSDRGFRDLGDRLSHQQSWRKSVYEVYQDASLPWEWTETLRAQCAACGIAYLTTPYDLEAVDFFDQFVPAFKIGSGDITWYEMLRRVAHKGKPVILSTGASIMAEVVRAVEIIQGINPDLAVLQCNTNYTGQSDNICHVNLRVLAQYRAFQPPVVVGLSDHTMSHAADLGAVALGAKIIEKHFTDDPLREGPDHWFSMTRDAFAEMVVRTRELEAAMGDGIKRIEPNEQQTHIVQRRAIRAARPLEAGTVLQRSDLAMLRPCPAGALPPYAVSSVIRHVLGNHKRPGACIYADDVYAI